MAATFEAIMRVIFRLYGKKVGILSKKIAAIGFKSGLGWVFEAQRRSASVGA